MLKNMLMTKTLWVAGARGENTVAIVHQVVNKILSITKRADAYYGGGLDKLEFNFILTTMRDFCNLRAWGMKLNE